MLKIWHSWAIHFFEKKFSLIGHIVLWLTPITKMRQFVEMKYFYYGRVYFFKLCYFKCAKAYFLPFWHVTIVTMSRWSSSGRGYIQCWYHYCDKNKAANKNSIGAAGIHAWCLLFGWFCLQWRHQGWAYATLLEALPPLDPPLEWKVAKISHFGHIFGFSSPQECILPPRCPHKNSGAVTVC